VTRFLVPLLALGMFAGCGATKSASTPKPLTHGRLVYLADRACAIDLRNGRALAPVTNRATFIKGLRSTIKSGERLISVLNTLTPPPSDAKVYRRLLSAEDYADSVATHVLANYGSYVTVHAFKHDVRRLKRISRRIKANARKLGMHVCAKDA
jgi:hypothetical protein